MQSLINDKNVITIKGQNMNKENNLSWRLDRYNNIQKVYEFLKENRNELNQIQEITEIPRPTLYRITNADMTKLKNIKWESINTLAKLSDEKYVDKTLGDRPEVVTKTIGLLVDERITGNDELAIALRKIIKSDPLIMATIAELIAKRTN